MVCPKRSRDWLIPSQKPARHISEEDEQAGLPGKLTFQSLRYLFSSHTWQKGADHGDSKIMRDPSPQVTADFYDHTTA